MLPTDWANIARGARYQQNTEEQQAINILESVILGRQVPCDAAIAIAVIYEPLIAASNINAVDVFWAILSDAARACGDIKEQANRLTDLVIALQQLPDLADESGHPIRNLDGEMYWKDLPAWRIVFREYGIDIDGPGDSENEWRWREQALPLQNATTFAATLLDSAPFRTGMDFHACTALECALRISDDSLENQQYAELYLPAAAIWILVAGQKLHDACMNSQDSGHVMKLSPERWDEWEQRFESMAANIDISSDGRQWAKRAAIQMQQYRLA